MDSFKRLKNVVEKYMIETFTSKNTNSSQWIDIFEKERTRLDMMTDVKNAIHMDNSCAGWSTWDGMEPGHKCTAVQI